MTYSKEASAAIEAILKRVRRTLEAEAMNVAQEHGHTEVMESHVEEAWTRSYE